MSFFYKKHESVQKVTNSIMDENADTILVFHFMTKLISKKIDLPRVGSNHQPFG